MLEKSFSQEFPQREDVENSPDAIPENLGVSFQRDDSYSSVPHTEFMYKLAVHGFVALEDEEFCSLCPILLIRCSF